MLSRQFLNVQRMMHLKKYLRLLYRIAMLEELIVTEKVQLINE